MEKEEAKEKFRLADRLFAEQQFAPALKVLTELNSSFPNERHILYPMARCLTGLGRNAEALDLADRVVRQFNYPPAVELYKRLKTLKTGDGLAALESTSDPVIPGAMSFDSDPVELPAGVPRLDSDPVVLPAGVPKFDSDPVVLPPGVPKFDSDLPKLSSELGATMSAPSRPSAVPPPLVVVAGPPWTALSLWIGLAVLCFIVTVIVSVTVGKPLRDWVQHIQQLQTQNTAPTLEEIVEGFPVGAFLIMLTIGSIASYVYACFPSYWALRVMDALPFNNFADDMKDVAIWTMIGVALLPIIFIGWIILLILLKRHYDLSFGKLVSVVALWCIFDIGLSFVIQILYTIVSAAIGAA